jgi:phage repressor protein C with HTH and peptisase S24 domain
MLTHPQIWRAIDALAARHGMSPSGLAKLAGLDPTTFNKSKRGTASGKLRWPSTESLAKVLQATGASLEDFVALVSEASGRAGRIRMIPLIGMAQAGSDGYFDDAGFPAGSGWEDIAFPDIADEHCYALEIIGDSMLPVYRDGDRILVSPSGSLRRGDRVVVKSHGGEVMAKQLGRMTAQRIELKSFNPQFEDRSFALSDIAFIHRIIWASQ